MLHAIRRWFSRALWGRRLLRRLLLPAHDAEGLLLIQIDGLSRRQLEMALKSGTMPFLRRLIRREGYEIHTHYSGVPSATSAVQAELFFGVRTAVPAHAFGDRQGGRVVTMLDSDRAAAIEAGMQVGHQGLLEEGSAYSNIFTGGALHPHFCASALGWGDLFKGVHPLWIAAFLLLHAEAMIRIAGQAIVEFGVAAADCLRGVGDWKEFREAVKFLPSRVGVAVVIRELIAISAAVDASAGLPVIQLNFLGYDEHAHRRGPDSKFAHWTLRGIDRCVRHVWKAAAQSERRHYQVWIYSDHGQERVTPYDVVTGRLIADVVRTTFGMDDILVAAIGPLGHVYLPFLPDREQLMEACRKLATDGGVPLVLMPDEPGKAVAWTADGKFELPSDARQILGDAHPFREVAACDLVAVCHHANAGDVIIAGWSAGRRPLSFVFEKGGHGGIGPFETGGFVLLPGQTPIEQAHTDFVRPEELRQAGLLVLGRSQASRANGEPTRRDFVRVMTYNVHSCMGLDGRLSIRRIARVLAERNADVIALQELDVRHSRTSFQDQARELAQRLGMAVHFHPVFSVASEHYGDAVLCRFPMRLVRAAALPQALAGRPREPRGALWVAIDCGGWELQLINTHLGLRSGERLVQVEELLGPNWLNHPQCRGPQVLCGDFNATPTSPAYRRITNRLRDAQRAVAGFRPRRTWCSPLPLLRIDHVFVSRDLDVAAVHVPNTGFVRKASDHLPVLADLKRGAAP
ncbi:MAG TPA: endonuclease/exonuclease/phosphatase family protein [Planctomycetaceae bacterium]|jgi:endonuclease/exonuclease/phosphatase family metal-dependent hydrolase